LSCLIFVLTLGGILLGTLLRPALPEHHLQQGFPGRGAAWCRPDRENNRRHGKPSPLSDDIKELVATDVFLATTHER
jgi:hypothetical protein